MEFLHGAERDELLDSTSDTMVFCGRNTDDNLITGFDPVIRLHYRAPVHRRLALFDQVFEPAAGNIIEGEAQQPVKAFTGLLVAHV